MNDRIKSGLGELLRYVTELVDQGAEAQYRELKINYRARYTPVLRAISAGAQTVTDITARTNLTQGAVSQTIGLMISDGIIARHSLEDGRKSGIHLTTHGTNLLSLLIPLWQGTFAAIDVLEREVGHPLLRVLEDTARALERKSFSSRLAETRMLHERKELPHDA
ncbi:MarR family transcriptional regulator [Acetobacter thailandicus]|uniref:MarR family transcriptional regulator n=1 Tax=Acetobacter thailandicus TaxID=1502842 RepID=UPI001BA73908|nr:MarR family transcriptional regulator [Acetobacter thailandicus]MBS0985920.1 MarR family transcriptional regulator [Acetobacter thailandicus]